MSYDEIKRLLSKASRSALAGDLSGAHVFVQCAIEVGASRHDIAYNLGPDVLKLLREDARKNN